MGIFIVLWPLRIEEPFPKTPELVTASSEILKYFTIGNF